MAISPVIAVPKYQEDALEVTGNSVRIDSVRMAVTVVSKPDRVRAEMTRVAPAPRITTLDHLVPFPRIPQIPLSHDGLHLATALTVWLRKIYLFPKISPNFP